jgi:hypothetical protein
VPSALYAILYETAALQEAQFLHTRFALTGRTFFHCYSVGRGNGTPWLYRGVIAIAPARRLTETAQLL